VAAFLVVDFAFLGANLLKFVDGGYVPAVVGSAFVVIMIVWTRGRGLLRAHYEGQSEPTAAFLDSLSGRIDTRLDGVAVVMTATGQSIPPVLLNIVRHFRTLHRTVLLTTIVTEEVPHVADDQATLETLGDGLYRVVLRYGFVDNTDVHRRLSRVLDHIVPGADPATLTYVLGQERIVPSRAGRMGLFSERVFAALSRNAANPSDFFGLPSAQVVEVGARVDL
jgi:KUP system potassium uptake protein